MDIPVFIILISTVILGFMLLYNMVFATKKKKKKKKNNNKLSKNYSRDIRIKKIGKCKYPIEAKKLNIEAVICIDLHIDENGNILEFQIPYKKGHGFEREAYKYIRQWEFKPAISNNKAIDSWIRIPIQFKLDRRIK